VAEAAARKTVLELLTLAAGYLDKKGVPSARREADALLGHVLGCDRLHLYLRFEEQPLPAEVDAFRALMLRRGEREPLQYLTGRCRFLDFTVLCDKRALIPRPETEDLAKLALELLGPAAGRRVADIGTGSGCLALAMAKAGAAVTAVDLSPLALELAGENALALGLSLDLRQGDLCAPLDGLEPFDLLLSNPPYIGEAEREGLQPEVGRHEPAMALFSGPEGLDAPRSLLAQAQARLQPGAWLVMELGLGQAARLAAEAAALGWAEARTSKDSFDVERFLACRRAP
jgi:release factor glutamine methyltransferase